MNSSRYMTLRNQRGATAVYAAVVIAVLVMFTALGIDVNYLYGVRNELQNAADAGALAGAARLLNSEGELDVTAAEAEARIIATANHTGSESVADPVVEIGHWSFTAQTFTASESTTQGEWQERPFSELDTDPTFINAVRVETRRADTPSFFARIFNISQFNVAADAVAYLGFAGTLAPGELDQPIAICKQSIVDSSGTFSCSMGRMLNSGSNIATSNTGGWTNFSQPCETASASDMSALVCSTGNTESINFGEGIGATGGVQNSTLSDLYDCWAAATNKEAGWSMTLPVIDCPGNNVSNCAELMGAVTVEVVWIINQNDPQYNDVPRRMQAGGETEAWTCPIETDGFTCWKSFVDHYDLANVDGPPASDEEYETMYQNKNLFFLPSCKVEEPRGGSGGENYGIQARIPKLVE